MKFVEDRERWRHDLRTMAFGDLAQDSHAVRLLQRSLANGRLAHAYLFTGSSLDSLQVAAANLAKALHCQVAQASAGRVPTDSCGNCAACHRVDSGNHADVFWVRPESKARNISIEQIRDLVREIQLKPHESSHKVGIIVAADRLGPQAANAFLKTLEEPPGQSVLILLSTQSERLLPTVLSRCLRLSFGVQEEMPDQGSRDWLMEAVASTQPLPGLLGRYQLLNAISVRLKSIRSQVEEESKAKSLSDQFEDTDARTRERWEEERTASVEAEYRRRRQDLLGLIHLWLRDVWVLAATKDASLLTLPNLQKRTAEVSTRISVEQASENLSVLERIQQMLNLNVQEALALEASLLRLAL